MAIIPVPSTRVSDSLVRERLLAQVQFDQKELFRIQSQVSTGRRILLPSEDAPAALRAINLQRLLERKEQVQGNLVTNQSFMSATDSAMASISGVLADIKGSVLSVAGTTSSDVQRQAVATEIERAIEQMIDTGNRQFRGRYLFAGTKTTVQPFESQGNSVRYNGNEGELVSYSDIDVLFESSISGNEVFGAISATQQGIADLNPVLHNNTLLSNLQGGNGISRGSLEISDGSFASIVDLSGANTIGDVARLIEANPPSGRSLAVSVLPTGLKIEFDDGGGGILTINEVGGGTTAAELGIRVTQGTPNEPIVGNDLNPILLKTTRLEDILGTRAQARVQSLGANNDLLIQANSNGASFNDVTVQFVDNDLLQAGAGLTAGNELATYSETATAASASLSFSGADNDIILTANTAGLDFNNVSIVLTSVGPSPANPTATYTDVAGTRTLTLGINNDGSTKLEDLITEIETNTPFTVTADDSAGEGFDDQTLLSASDIGVVTGNTGNSGGAAKTLFVQVESNATTAQQVLDAINAEGTFSAQVDIRDTSLAGQAGNGLIQLDATATTAHGSGINFDKDSGIRVTNGNQTYDISFSKANTFEDLLNTINGAGAGLLATLNDDRSGINVRSRLSGADFSIGELGGTTATELGIRSFTENTQLSDLNHGLGVEIIDGTDFIIQRNDGSELEIDLSGAQSIQDVLDIINNHAGNQDTQQVTARLATFGNGIEIVDDAPSGLDSFGSPNTLRVVNSDLGIAAVQLGLIPTGAEQSDPPTAAVAASGRADFSAANADLLFTAREGGTPLNDVRVEFTSGTASGNQALVSYNPTTKVLSIDVDPLATTAATVASSVSNQPGGLFEATLDTTDGPNDGSGLISELTVEATLAGGTEEVLTGQDVNPSETTGIFNSLLRLRDALTQNDLNGLERALSMLEDDITNVNFARAEIGARQQSLDILQVRLESEEVDLRSALSLEIDVDFTEAVSELASRQVSIEASLRASASLLQLTLLNFL